MEKKAGGVKGNIIKVVKALIASYVLTGILLMILTLIFYKANISNTKIYIGVVVIYILANLAGGFIIGRITGEKKFVWGVILGVSYFVILSLVSFIGNRSFYENGVNALVALAACTAGGMFGGMLS